MYLIFPRLLSAILRMTNTRVRSTYPLSLSFSDAYNPAGTFDIILPGHVHRGIAPCTNLVCPALESIGGVCESDATPYSTSLERLVWCVHVLSVLLREC